MCDQLHSPTATLWKRSLGTHRKEGWVGPEAGLDVLEKRYILALAGIELRFLVCLTRNCIPPPPSGFSADKSTLPSKTQHMYINRVMKYQLHQGYMFRL